MSMGNHGGLCPWGTMGAVGGDSQNQMQQCELNPLHNPPKHNLQTHVHLKHQYRKLNLSSSNPRQCKHNPNLNRQAAAVVEDDKKQIASVKNELDSAMGANSKFSSVAGEGQDCVRDCI